MVGVGVGDCSSRDSRSLGSASPDLEGSMEVQAQVTAPHRCFVLCPSEQAKSYMYKHKSRRNSHSVSAQFGFTRSVRLLRIP